MPSKVYWCDCGTVATVHRSSLHICERCDRIEKANAAESHRQNNPDGGHVGKRGAQKNPHRIKT